MSREMGDGARRPVAECTFDRCGRVAERTMVARRALVAGRPVVARRALVTGPTVITGPTLVARRAVVSGCAVVRGRVILAAPAAGQAGRRSAEWLGQGKAAGGHRRKRLRWGRDELRGRSVAETLGARRLERSRGGAVLARGSTVLAWRSTVLARRGDGHWSRDRYTDR